MSFHKEYYWGCGKTCVPWRDTFKTQFADFGGARVSSSNDPDYHNGGVGFGGLYNSDGIARDVSTSEPYMGSTYELEPLGTNYLAGTPEGGFHTGFGSGDYSWGFDYSKAAEYYSKRVNPVYIWDYVKEQAMSVSAGWTPSEGSWPLGNDSSLEAVKAWEQNWGGFYSELDPNGLYALFVHGSTNYAADVQATITTNSNFGIPYQQIANSTHNGNASAILKQFCPLVQIGGVRLAWTTSYNSSHQWHPFAHPPAAYTGGSYPERAEGIYPRGDFSKVHPVNTTADYWDAVNFSRRTPSIMSATGVTERGTPFALFHGESLGGFMSGGGVPNTVRFTTAQPQVKLEMWYTTHYGGWPSYNTGATPSFDARFILRKMRSLYRVWCQNLHPNKTLVGLRCVRLQGGLVQDFPLLPQVEFGECNAEEYMMEMNFPFGGNEGMISMDAQMIAGLIHVYGLFSDGSTQLGLQGRFHAADTTLTRYSSGNRGFKRHLALRFEP